MKVGWAGVMLLMAACLIGGCAYPKELSAVLKKADVSLDLKRRFEVVEDRRIGGRSSTMRHIRAQAGTHIIRIQEVSGLSEETARQMIADQCYLIDSRFNKQQVPYPGPLSNMSECPQELRPMVEREEGAECLRVYYHMFANQRLVCGGYDEGTLAYGMDLMLAYCKRQQRWYKIEYFAPKQEGTNEGRTTLRSFRCCCARKKISRGT